MNDERQPVPTTRRPRRRADERGAALVEFALVVPVLLTIVVGALTGGLVLQRKQSLAHAAHEGARYGATVPMDQCEVVATCGGQTWAQLVRNVVVNRSAGSAAATDVCVALVTGAAATVVDGDVGFTTDPGGAPCYADGGSDVGTRVQVRIVRSDQRINAVLTKISVPLRVESTARYEQ